MPPENEFAIIRNSVTQRSSCVADAAASRLILRSTFDAFEGEITTGSWLRIGMPIGAPVSARQNSCGSIFEGWWQADQVMVTPSHCKVESRTGKMQMVGLAIDLERCGGLDDTVPGKLQQISIDRVFEDPLLSAVLHAMWHEAEVHGASTAFFDQAVTLVTQRLCDIEPISAETVKALGRDEFAKVTDFIESRLASDISVAEMATTTRRDPSGFTRAFRATTGLTPFRYLTVRRMERAAQLFAEGCNVSQAAARVGYSNASKFAAAFARVKGVSPARFKRSS